MVDAQPGNRRGLDNGGYLHRDHPVCRVVLCEVGGAGMMRPIHASAIKRAILRRKQTAEESTLSMLHMHHSMMSDRTEKGSAAMQWGTMTHAAILEPETVAVYPGKRRQGKEWVAFESEHGDCHIVTASEWERLTAIRDAAMSNNLARHLIGNCQHEHVLEWDDPQAGPCAGRADLWRGGVSVTDLKVMRYADPDAIRTSIYRDGLDIQLAWYRAAAGLAGGSMVARIIAIEPTPPYAVTVAEIPPQHLDAAYRYAVDICLCYRACEAAGSFPGPTLGEMTYEPPTWASALEDDGPPDGMPEGLAGEL
jgi:hypothetical protein